jgi:hypothetical protein
VLNTKNPTFFIFSLFYCQSSDTKIISIFFKPVKHWLSIVACCLLILGLAPQAQAGFGISPPYLKSAKPLFAGTLYEQRITLLRSSAEDELTADITVDAPDIKDWVTIDKGYSFDLPPGELQVPMLVRVQVPEDAPVGKYSGHINVRIKPRNAAGSGVAIALGARVDIDLEVTDETFLDFIIRTAEVGDLEELTAPWNWPVLRYFFYRIHAPMKLENTGNVKIAPTKVQLDVYDINERGVIESLTDDSVPKVDPFETATVSASFPTQLPAGQYWGRLRIYRDKDIVFQDKRVFTIYPPGGLPGGTDLGHWPWTLGVSAAAIALIALWLFVRFRAWRFAGAFIWALLWPLRFLLRLILRLLGYLKVAFLRWLHRKTGELIRPERDRNDPDS